MEDVAAQVCTHIVRFFSVASMFPACREKMVEMPELVKNICRVFYYKVRMPRWLLIHCLKCCFVVEAMIFSCVFSI